MKVFLTIALYRIKSFYRDRFTFLFSFLLPIIFIVIFGFVFGGEPNGAEDIKIAVLNSQIEVLDVIKEIPKVTIEKLENIEKMRNLVLKGNVDCGVILEKEKFKLILNFSSFQQKPFLRTLGDTISSYYSRKEAGFKKLIEIKEEIIDPGKTQISSLGYSIPGVMSFSLASGMFVMITLFGFYKKRGILKRFAITPINSFSFTFGMTIGNFLIILVSSIFILFFSRFLFNIKFSINWGLYLLSVSTSILGMMGFGILLSSIFKEPQTANNVGMLLLNIMLFFSGVYFPLDFLPKYLKDFAKVLPLYYIGRALRISLGVEEGPSQFIFSLAIIMFLIFITLTLIFGRKLLETEK